VVESGEEEKKKKRESKVKGTDSWELSGPSSGGKVEETVFSDTPYRAPKWGGGDHHSVVEGTESQLFGNVPPHKPCH